MAVLRPHLAINVSSIERAVPFYEALFGVAASKVKPGYAKFELTEPTLNLALNEREPAGGLGAFNHGGIQVDSTDDVLAARLRLKSAGVASFEELDTTCCYARQDKIWVHDPDGTPWEIFSTHEDVDEFDHGAEAVAAADGRRSCC